MLEYIPLALSNLKAAKDILMTIQDLRDFEKISAATTELKERLIDSIDNVLASKDQLLTFDKRISDLEQENNRLKDWSAEKTNYSWMQIADGVSAYVQNNFKGNLQDARKLCCNCFEKTIKSTLQQKRAFVGDPFILICPNGCPPLEFEFYKEHK